MFTRGNDAVDENEVRGMRMLTINDAEKLKKIIICIWETFRSDGWR